MKNKKRILIVTLALCFIVGLLTGCESGEAAQDAQPGLNYPKQLGIRKETATYIENELYVWNAETERKIYSFEIMPKNLTVDEKIPMIIYVHGGNGSADALVVEPENLATDKIAGFTFESCGGNKVSPRSDGKEINNSHFTSRISDLMAVVEYVKTLDYVDQSKVYIYGQSYGGTVVSCAAPLLNDYIAGMIMESSGISENGNYSSLDPGTNKGLIEKYLPPEDYISFFKSFTKDVIVCCSEGDAGAYAGGQNAVRIYNERSVGKATFYSCPEGAHAFNSFSEAGKSITYDAMRELVLGND